MKKYNVRKEWLCDENGNIVKMPLREWFEYFQISEEAFTYQPGHCYQTYKSKNKKERNGYIDIYKSNGYGLQHHEVEQYMDKLFRTGNADFDVKLVQC